jgi:hypothetical protein
VKVDFLIIINNNNRGKASPPLGEGMDIQWKRRSCLAATSPPLEAAGAVAIYNLHLSVANIA